MKNSILKYSFVHALGATAYITLVALLIQNIERIVGPSEGSDNILAPIAFLLLFVISAAAMGLLIFARPIMWYLNGSKKEAVTLAIATVSWLIIIAAIIFLAIIFGMV